MENNMENAYISFVLLLLVVISFVSDFFFRFVCNAFYFVICYWKKSTQTHTQTHIILEIKFHINLSCSYNKLFAILLLCTLTCVAHTHTHTRQFLIFTRIHSPIFQIKHIRGILFEAIETDPCAGAPAKMNGNKQPKRRTATPSKPVATPKILNGTLKANGVLDEANLILVNQILPSAANQNEQGKQSDPTQVFQYRTRLERAAKK